MSATPASLLPAVIDAAYQAGAMLAAEFVRPDGPRFRDHVTAPVDVEMELALRDRLVSLFPARFVGEEAGVLAAEANGYCWVVDPHDGTRAFLEGKRGSAVSVALLHDGIPVLGVVYAPLSPDRGQDMIAWAEGTPGITRNGALVPIDLRERELTATDVVFLNHGVWQRPIFNSAAVAPGRFMPLPSIAYRLARVAVGDGLATITLRPVNAHDVAAGHALLRAAGGVLTAEDGVPVTYDVEGQSRPFACFGGAPRVVETLRARTWRGSTEDRREPRIVLNWPRLIPEDQFDRAVGCLLGFAVGEAMVLGDPGPLTRQMLDEARGRNLGPRSFSLPVMAGLDPTDANLGGEGPPFSSWPDLFRPPGAAGSGEFVPLAVAGTGPAMTKIDGSPPKLARMEIDPTTSGHTARDFAATIAGKSPLDAALTGARLGALHGRAVIPVDWAMRVLTYRPFDQPEIAWADDLPDLAEALLLASGQPM